MRRILKRFTGLFCVLALCLSLLPVSALATELPVDQTAEETETTTQPPEDADTPEPEEEVSTSAEGTVAQIGATSYATLDEAVNAAEDGATIELLADATSEGMFLSKKLVIQAANGLNKKPTITFIKNGIAMGYGAAGAPLTFKDVNIVMTGIGSTPATGEWNWMTICAGNGAKITLDNVKMTMDGTGVSKDNTQAIYFCGGNELNILNGSNLTIQNYPHNALSWNEGNEYITNIVDSTFVSDGNRSGFTGTFDVNITNSKVKVINSRGNGSNGSHFIIKNSDVDFNNNGSHGLSAGELSIDNSTVNTKNNNGMGITVNNAFTVENGSIVTVTGNAGNSSYGYAAVRLYNNYPFTVDSTSELYIEDNNNTGLYVRQGNLTVEDGAVLKITGNKVSHSLLDGYGGGIYVGYGDNYDPTVILPADAIICNNHALVAGDDIYVSEGVSGPSLTFGKVGSGWTLDGGEGDCIDAIDGWYDDSEGARWEAHEEPYHAVEFTDFEPLTGFASATGLTALKAAHGLSPLEPGEETGWDTSKSKTATNLDSNFESDVTLSLPAAEEQLVTDVVFVLDKSTSATVEAKSLEMLRSLKDQLENTGAKINVGVVIFNAVANVANNGEFFDLATEYADIEAAIQQTLKSGTNMHAGLLAGKAMLDADTSVDSSRKYLILVSDGLTYYYCKGGNYDQAYTISSRNGGDTGTGGRNEQPNDGLSAWECKYSSDYVPENWASYFDAVKGVLDSEYTKYEYSLNDPNRPKTSDLDSEGSIPYVNRNGYPINVDLSLYNSNALYQEMSKEYHCYALKAESGVDSYGFGISFMDYLAGGETVDFADIQNDIYYLLDKGSYVVDEIGSGTDNKSNGYDFDFVNDIDRLALTVDGEVLDKTELIDPSFNDPYITSAYGFGFNDAANADESAYDFVLKYYAKGQDGASDECFVWEINVPVSNFAPVQLTYTVKLTNPQTAEGTYGQYDADGSENYSGLYTNNSATLYPVDSNSRPGQPENFRRPTVSYTIQTSRPDPGRPSHRPDRDDEPESLNTEDHVAYIIGYTDGTVRPEGDIARSEVATIFFRLLTDEAREAYWSQTNPYSDVASGDWYNNAISTLTSMGILDGYPDGTFRPTEPITRSEFTKIAVSFFEFTEGDFTYDGRFSDVEGTEWYVTFLAAAVEYGLIEGMPDGTFHPLDNITRAEACTIVNRTLGRAPHEAHLLPRGEMLTWPDNNTSAWYYAAMQEATNSHDYIWTEGEDTEAWTGRLTERDWAALERVWSDAHDAPGGEVMD